MFSIDDDDDPLDAIFSSVETADSGSAPVAVTQHTPDTSTVVDDDLSWLDDAVGGVTVSTSDATVDVNTTSVDDFLSEVFGESSNNNQAIGVTENSFIDSVICGQGEVSAIAEIETVVCSAYPDVDHLKQLLLTKTRMLPADLRAKVWCLLLTGQVPDSVAEAEISRWDIRTSLEMTYKEDVIADCREIFASSQHHGDTYTQGEAGEQDLINILAYHCVKYDVAYSGYYSSCEIPATRPVTSATIFSVLYPLLALQRQQQRRDGAGGEENRSSQLELLSQCYCSLQAQFFPLMQAAPPVRRMALSSLCNMVRLLLRYHCPLLANKLDIDIPDWWRLRETPGSDQEGGGCLCEAWLIGFFSGTVPPEMACLVLDWSILSREPLAGVYAIVSLLCVFAEPLLTMNALEVLAWFESIAAVGVGEPPAHRNSEWFKLLSVTMPDSEPTRSLDMLGLDENQGGAFSTSDLTWSEFTSGWVFALQAVRLSTPASFRRAVDGVEEWCAEQYRTQRADATGLDLGGGRDAEPERDDACSPSSPTQSHIYCTVDEVVPSLCSNLAHRQQRTQSNAADSDADGNCKERFFVGARDARRRGSGAGVLPGSREEEAILYFAVDCRSLAQKVLGKLPKAYELDCEGLHTDADGALDARSPALTELLEVLGPLADCSHVCLLGAGHNTYVPGAADPQAPVATGDATGPSVYGSGLLNSANMNALGSSLFTAAKALSQQVQVGVAGLSGLDPVAAAAAYRLYARDIDRQLPQVAEFLVRHKFRHVSILEGGYTAALRLLHGHSRQPHFGPRHTYSVDSTLIDVDKALLQGFVQGAKSLAGICWRPAGVAGTTGTPSPIPAATATTQSQHSIGDDRDVGTWTDAPPESPTTPAAPTVVGEDGASPLGTVDSAATVDAARQMAGAIGRRLSIFGAASYDNIKKGVGVISAEVEAKRAQLAAQQLEQQQAQEAALELRQIEEEEARARVQANPSLGTIHGGTTPQKSEQEKALALAMHTLAGVRVGDPLRISRETLPGAVLFPALIYVSVDVDGGENVGPTATGEGQGDEPTSESVSIVASATPGGTPVAAVVPASTTVGKHRFLVVTPERFIILDAKGGGVGSDAIVEANHHLTELLKITFRKRDPELVNIFFVNLDANVNRLAASADTPTSTPSNAIQFRVVRRKEFVEALQKNMQRFR